MTEFCPHCPHCCAAAQSSDNARSVALGIAIGLRSACLASNRRITGDGRVDEATAAMLVGREPGTLRNWRSQHCPIPFVKRGGRVTYLLEDIAVWLATTDEFEQK